MLKLQSCRCQIDYIIGTTTDKVLITIIFNIHRNRLNGLCKGIRCTLSYLFCLASRPCREYTTAKKRATSICHKTIVFKEIYETLHFCYLQSIVGKNDWRLFCSFNKMRLNSLFKFLNREIMDEIPSGNWNRTSFLRHNKGQCICLFWKTNGSPMSSPKLLEILLDSVNGR